MYLSNIALAINATIFHLRFSLRRYSCEVTADLRKKNIFLSILLTYFNDYNTILIIIAYFP